MDRHSDSLIGKVKAMCTSKSKMNLFTPSCQQADVQLLPGKQGLSTIMVACTEKCHNHRCPIFLLVSLRIYCRVRHPVVWVNSLGYIHSQPPVHPQPTCSGWEEKKHWHCTSTVQQQPKHWCVISTVWATNAKHRHIWTAMKRFSCFSRWWLFVATPLCFSLCFLPSNISSFQLSPFHCHFIPHVSTKWSVVKWLKLTVMDFRAKTAFRLKKGRVRITGFFFQVVSTS